jgi:hypothetical protein
MKQIITNRSKLFFISLCFFILLISCKKEVCIDYNRIQVSIIPKDVVKIEYFNGITTLNISTINTWSTCFDLPDNTKLSMKAVSSKKFEFKCYVNGNIYKIAETDSITICKCIY